MYVRRGGLDHNYVCMYVCMYVYKICKGGPRKKYVCKEGGFQKIFLSPPPPHTFFLE